MYELAESMKDRGSDVFICSSGPESTTASKELFEKSKSAGIQHIYLPSSNKISLTLFGYVKMALQYFLFTPYFIWVLWRHKPDILHFHYPVLTFVGAMYKLISGKKYVVTHHITGIPKNFLYQNGDYVIAISQDIKKELVNIHKYHNAQIKVVYNGVSALKYNGARGNKEEFFKKYSISNNAPVIGFVGSINKRKGLDILLKALSTLEQNFNLIIVGDDIKSKFLTSLIEQYGLSNKVFLFSFQDPYSFYQIFDIFVLPSRAEGFPLVTIEAMLMRIPVIRSNTGGSAEQVLHGENGYVFENEKYSELGKYCSVLLENETLRRQMGSFGREYALDNFTKKQMVHKTWDIYQKLLN